MPAEAQFPNDATQAAVMSTIDRRKLGPIVFKDKSRMEALNGIVWPAIASLAAQELTRLKADEGVELVCLEAAVLLEAGNARSYHVYIVLNISHAWFLNVTWFLNATTSRAQMRYHRA